MAKKEKVGLYLGINSVAVSLVAAKELIATSYADISSDQDSIESLQENVRIQASLNKILREANIESKEVNLSLADRNFIFRYLELPLMNKKDVESSLIFEIEKYIPFKAEELLWDYESIQSKKEKKTKVFFVGMRKSNYNQIKDIFSQLDLSLKTLEPASISLARLIKTKKDFSKSKHFAILDVTDYEGYLTFFQDELPVFNRNFDISKIDEEFDKNKFIEAVSYSFQYFRREYKKSDIEKIIVISAIIDEEIVDSLKKVLGVDIEKVTFPGLSSLKKQLVTEEIKATGAAQRENIPYKFKLVFEKRESTAVVGSAKLTQLTTGWRYGVLAGLITAGVLVCFYLWFRLDFKIAREEKNLMVQDKNREKIDGLRDFNKDKIEQIINEKKDQISYLKKRESLHPDIWLFLRFLEQDESTPSYLWLKNLHINLEGDGYTGKILGYVYFQDRIKENKAVDKFIKNLKRNENISKIFSDIQLNFVSKEVLENYSVTSFNISLKK